MHHWLEPVGLILGYAAVALLPYIRKSFQAFLKNKTDYLSKNIKIRRQIDEIVNELRIYMQANRCMIKEFSNTEKSTGGFPFEYATITYEHTDTNLVHIKNTIQKVPVSNMIDWLSPLTEGARFNVFHDNDPKNPDAVQFQMQNMALSTVVYFKITSALKDGVIVFHFNRSYTEDLMNQNSEDLKQLRYQASRIYALMRTLKK